MHTIELLDRALKRNNESQAALARRLGLSTAALAVARHAGHLSPSIAGAIADDIGEDAGHWSLQAAAEGEKNPTLKRRLAAAVRNFVTRR